MRDILQRQFIPEYDARLQLRFESPIAADKQHHLDVAKAAPWSLTVDEWREMQGREALPNGAGQVFMMPFNLVPSAKLEQVKQVAKAPGDDTDDLVGRVVAAVDEKALRDVLLPQHQRVVEAFGGAMLAELTDAPARAGATIRDIPIDIGFDLANPRVVHFLETECGNMIKRINRTTKDAVRATLAQGVADGESIPHLAERVASVFDAAQGYRAERIARTEVLRASNFGGYEGMIQGGVEKKSG